MIVPVTFEAEKRCIFKIGGDPLSGGDSISFDGITLPLAGAGYKESMHKGKTIRAWGVPDGRSSFYAMVEILELQ